MYLLYFLEQLRITLSSFALFEQFAFVFGLELFQLGVKVCGAVVVIVAQFAAKRIPTVLMGDSDRQRGVSLLL